MLGQSKTAYVQWTIVGALFLIFWYVQSLANSVPINFPLHKTFTVEENETLKSMSLRLEEGHYVNSALLFRVFVSSRGIDRHIKVGGYAFDESLSLQGVVEKFATGHPDVPLVSLTVPEGSSVNEIASFVHKAIPAISEETFLSLVDVGGFSGRLFPSTYFLLPSTTAESIIKMMKT